MTRRGFFTTLTAALAGMFTLPQWMKAKQMTPLWRQRSFTVPVIREVNIGGEKVNIVVNETATVTWTQCSTVDADGYAMYLPKPPSPKGSIGELLSNHVLNHKGL